MGLARASFVPEVPQRLTFPRRLSLSPPFPVLLPPDPLPASGQGGQPAGACRDTVVHGLGAPSPTFAGPVNWPHGTSLGRGREGRGRRGGAEKGHPWSRAKPQGLGGDSGFREISRRGRRSICWG